MTASSPAPSPAAAAGPVPSPEGLLARFRERFHALDLLGSSLTDREWYAPAALPVWSVLDVYAHLIGAESMSEGYELPYVPIDVARLDHVSNQRAVENETWIESLSRLTPPSMLDRFRRIAAARLRRIETLTPADLDAPAGLDGPAGSPVGPASHGRLLQIRLFELWMHEQDVREGLGRPGNQTGPGAEDVLEEAVRRLGPALAERVAAEAGTTVAIDLTGPLVRRLELVAGTGRWELPAGAEGATGATADAEVAMSSSLFLRLIGGRIAALSPRLGGIEFAGDLALATSVATSLTVTD